MSNLREVKETRVAKRVMQTSSEDLGVQVGGQVCLRAPPTKGVMRFGQSSKLTPRYICPYFIIEGVEEVACWVKLLEELPRVHCVFHVYHLCKYIPDPTLVIKPEPLQLREDLSYKEQLIEILDL